jgi:signal transduction histidine kinase/ligand-binding sensor domain-containing protein
METCCVRRLHTVSLGIVLAGVLLASYPCALALDPTLDVSQYAHKSWKVREGFTKGRISSIAQTPDGYLWLGTEFGLLRFDGVRAVPWQPPQGQNLPSANIVKLLVARDGTLWIGTTKGLASWKERKLIQYAELSGQAVFALLEDHAGTIWASGRASTDPGRLCAIHSGSSQCWGEDGVLYEDSKGNLWVGVFRGLWRWRPGPPQFYSMPDELAGIHGFGEDDDGALLIGTHDGVKRFVDGKAVEYSLTGTAQRGPIYDLLRDHDGGLWIGTSGRGIVHVHQGRTDVFAESDSLSSDQTLRFFEDGEGNIWVASLNGLDRFREFAVPTFTESQGLSGSYVYSVLAATDGSVWLSTTGGLDRWKSGQITVYGKPGAHGKLNGQSPGSLFQDSHGRIWVAANRQFGYLENDGFVPISAVPGGPVHGIAEDTAGSLWVANQEPGLFRLLRSGEVQQFAWTTLGHKDLPPSVIADPLKGGVWVGFVNGGVTYFRDGEIRGSYTAADGLGEGRVDGFHFDGEGTLWIATEGGLSRLKDGHILTLTSKNGLPCDAVHWVTEDDLHSFWLYTACGLVRIARSELDAWATGADKSRNLSIEATVFDSFDGVRSVATAGSFQPQVTKTSDGKLWFSSGDGVSVIDPRHLHLNKIPPPVHVEQITADHKTYDLTSEANGSVRLPPRIRDLEIDYTALSLAAWEKVLFRYKLEGWDQDWQDAGNRRQAFYSNLPPGNYTFRVKACNNSGVWNEAGTSLDFYVAPAYYQTTWFRMLCVAAFLGLTLALYQLRLRYATQQVRGQMEARVKERERIARDLHDTLLQSVQGLILKFDAVARQIPKDEPARAALEKTLDHADRVMAEGRDRVRHLRANTVPYGGLPAAFQRVVEETPQGRETTFKTLVEGHVRMLHPMVREEAYCIGREALVNALTHSHGLQVEVEITYDARQFRLRVRDDGRGFDPKILEDGGRPGHWGLQGMRERCDRIGAQLKVWSGPETGTEIELTVPGAAAYEDDPGQSKSSWLRRFAGKDGEHDA